MTSVPPSASRGADRREALLRAAATGELSSRFGKGSAVPGAPSLGWEGTE